MRVSKLELGNQSESKSGDFVALSTSIGYRVFGNELLTRCSFIEDVLVV